MTPPTSGTTLGRDLTLGILGGGQLGRMIAAAAAQSARAAAKASGVPYSKKAMVG